MMNPVVAHDLQMHHLLGLTRQEGLRLAERRISHTSSGRQTHSVVTDREDSIYSLSILIFVRVVLES